MIFGYLKNSLNRNNRYFKPFSSYTQSMVKELYMVDQNPKIIGSDALLNLMTPFFGSTYANNFIKNLLINFRKENDLNPD